MNTPTHESSNGIYFDGETTTGLGLKALVNPLVSDVTGQGFTNHLIQNVCIFSFALLPQQIAIVTKLISNEQAIGGSYDSWESFCTAHNLG